MIRKKGSLFNEKLRNNSLLQYLKSLLGISHLKHKRNIYMQRKQETVPITYYNQEETSARYNEWLKLKEENSQDINSFLKITALWKINEKFLENT